MRVIVSITDTPHPHIKSWTDKWRGQCENPKQYIDMVLYPVYPRMINVVEQGSSRMRTKKNERVFLDHFIKQDCLRLRVPVGTEETANDRTVSDPRLRLTDLLRNDFGYWFKNLRKPDFQRPTNFWSPEDCRLLLNSLVNRRIIPALILWKSDETGKVYVLDGAHRLSAIAAWINDDWGDKDTTGFYDNHPERELAIESAIYTRDYINQTIGSYESFRQLYLERERLSEAGHNVLEHMTKQDHTKAIYYRDLVSSNLTLQLQWESGNYEVAEQSFLDINRGGKALEPLERALIEYRYSSFARLVMCTAARSNNSYWALNESERNGLSSQSIEAIDSFETRCLAISETLLKPAPGPVVVSMDIAPVVIKVGDRPHSDLREILPFLAYFIRLTDMDKTSALLQQDSTGSTQDMIINAGGYISAIETKLTCLFGDSSDNQSLSISPLVYWYSNDGNYSASLFFGFIGWLFDGDDEAIDSRKLIFASVRGAFEDTLIHFKESLGSLLHSSGGALKAVPQTKEALQLIFETIVNSRGDIEIAWPILAEKLPYKKPKEINPNKRNFTASQKNTLNIDLLLSDASRCKVCGGRINPSKVQYDHIDRVRDGGGTHVNNGRLTHPFCNNRRDRIEAIQSANEVIKMPVLENTEKVNKDQLNLF